MKKKVLVDVKVECDPPSWLSRYWRDVEAYEKELERWVSEFHDFIRDHRSQDPVSLNVVRVIEEQCEFCGWEWEVDTDGCPQCCQKAIDEWEDKKTEPQK